jgi:hypothetical protein
MLRLAVIEGDRVEPDKGIIKKSSLIRVITCIN